MHSIDTHQVFNLRCYFLYAINPNDGLPMLDGMKPHRERTSSHELLRLARNEPSQHFNVPSDMAQSLIFVAIHVVSP